MICKSCGNDEVSEVKCETCNGFGAVECPGGYDVEGRRNPPDSEDCPACEGEGTWLQCGYCGEKGDKP